MSSQGYYQQGSQDHQGQGLPQSNPWADQVSQQPQHQQQQQQQQYGAAGGQQGYGAPQQGYGAPQQGYSAPPGAPPRRAGTFEEGAFVPESERGEQREAMEQFEMSRSKPESKTDQDVAQLQQEFPQLDGSLIAALYGDSGSIGGAREMLQELAASQGQR